MFIIALGISVFIGLRESTAGMLYTADNYYDENNLMDFKIVSTHGLTKDDANALEELTNVFKVIPTYSVDTLSEGESIRIHSIEKDVNNVTLISGRMPKNTSECVADYYKYKVGDVIKFESNDLNDIITIKECKVVGTIKSVLYVRSEKGISTVGNGKLVSFAFVKKEVFISEYYTEIYLLAKDSKDQNSYYEDYNEKIDLLRSELEELKPIRETIRYEEIMKEANEEIIKVRKELEEKVNEATIKLNNSKYKLDKSKRELEKTKVNSINEFNSNYKNLNDNKTLIISNLNSMGITESDLAPKIETLFSTILSLKEQLKLLDNNSQEYQDLNIQISSLQENYDNLVSLKNNLLSIENGLKTLDEEYNKFQITIKENEIKIQNGYNEYYAGVNKLAQEQNEGNQKIEDAKEDLKTIEKPVWYLLDRTDNSGYISYKDDVIKIDAIAKILPIFFIIIVVLMISNTLTRLIEEERGEIGILLSNGFSKTSIIFSYLFYVFTSGLIGIAIGFTVGYSLVPKIIYGVFLSRYYVPKLITIVSPLPFSLVLIITLLIMALVTIIACRKELKEVPAILLRPKPPKSGKKTSVEKVKILWSNLNFMWKVTIRNLFRYKKRIIMTILGVAGCTALLVAGMGINDSINTIADLQYKTIIKYDAMYILDKEVNAISHWSEGRSTGIRFPVPDHRLRHLLME
jgi:putative ABC transport system permease protein